MNGAYRVMRHGAIVTLGIMIGVLSFVIVGLIILLIWFRSDNRE